MVSHGDPVSHGREAEAGGSEIQTIVGSLMRLSLQIKQDLVC